MPSEFIGKPVLLLYEWLRERTGLAWSEDFCAIGRVVDGALVGVIGFNGFTGTACQMHMAGSDRPGWATRKFIREAFRYAFVTCGCKVVFGVVPSGNDRAYDIDIRLGFEKLATIEGAHPDGALHFLMMRRENCRWLA